MPILRYLALSLALIALTACGSTGTTTPPGDDASLEEDASLPPEPPAPPAPPVCERRTCADLVKDGRVPCGTRSGQDGCGGTVACADPDAENQGCPEGFYCQGEDDGVARCQEREAEECTAVDEAVACADACGSVPTGCYGETYNCGGCEEGFFCQAGSCRPNTCTSQLDCSNAGPDGGAVSCGQWGDGCGGIIDCGAEVGCGAGEVCQFSTGTCIEEAPPACLKSAAEACAGTCGVVSDGCAGTYNCAEEGFACPEGICGVAKPGDTATCGTWDACFPDVEALRTACAGKCGTISDGCADVFDCSAPGNGGVSCTAPETCGGGGAHNICGVPDTGCVPLTKAEACDTHGYDCGPRADGCGGFVQCGDCAAGEKCGLGGASTCGPESCQPISAEAACADKCGMVSDGCDGQYNCSATPGGIANCPAGQICGYGGVPNVCGGEVCVPETCAGRGATCGTIITCGKEVNCWPDPQNRDCPNPATEACKELTPGVPVCTDQGGSGGCAGSAAVCGAVPACPSGSATRITGFVTTPDGELRVPNAIIYIQDPSEPLPAIPEGVDYNNPTASCERCDDQNHGLGRVLAAGTTDFKGEYTMTGAIPVGVPVRVVVKTGRWRGVYTHTFTQGCTTTNMMGTFKLPSQHDSSIGNHLPHIAVATGQVDAMECVLYKMGIDLSEFTNVNADGRIHMYRANGGRMSLPEGGGQCIRHDNDNTCRSNNTQQSRCSSKNTCETSSDCRNGGSNTQCRWESSVSSDRLTDANVNNGDLFDYDMVIWDCEAGVQTRAANPKARLLRYVNHGGRFFASHWSYDWLRDNGTLANAANYGGETSGDANANVSLSFGRARANPSKLPMFARWLHHHGAGSIQFGGNDEPISGSIYAIDLRSIIRDVNPGSDEWIWWNYSRHNSVQQFSFNTPFGAAEVDACGRVAFTAFHVATSGRNSLDTRNQFFPSYCDGSTLTDQEKTLAYMIFDLANCVSSGEPPRPPECEPKTVDDCAANQCGIQSDGCGGTINCGGCPGNDYCSPATGTCEAACDTVNPCADNGFVCGTFSDGCSGIVNCGTCPEGEICGLLNEGQCGSCRPATCDSADIECGLIADGCGDFTDCGSDCPEGQVCGGGGVPNQCGSGACNPAVCGEHDCGIIPDGCGGIVNCSTCPEGEACGIVEANICSPICDPLSFGAACDGLECGYVADGCGGSHYCGDCTNGGDCGGAGPNMCGEPCVPTSCAAEGANCGFVPDGCGTLLDCGTCAAGEVCGASSPNVCGVGVCDPITSCASVNAECGTISDGCDSQLECGGCPPGYYCSNSNVCEEGEGSCEPITCESLDAECGEPADGCGGKLDCGTCGANEVCGLFVQYACGNTG